MLNEFITKKLSEGVLRQLKDLRNVNTYIVAVVHNDGTEINSNAIISMNDLKAYDTVVRTPEELTVALNTAGLTSIFIAAPISVGTFDASTGSALSIYGYPLQIEGNITSSVTTPVKFFNVVNCTSSEFLNNADMHFRWLNGSVSKGLAANGDIYYENSSEILPAESFTFELWDNTVNFDHLPLASTSEYGVVKIAPDSDLGFDEHGNLTLTVGQDFFKYLKIGIEMADAAGSENIMEFVPSDDIEMSVSAGSIINLALAEIEGVEGSYGEDSDMAIQLENGGSFNIPYLQISPTGRVIASKNVEFILPSLLGTVGEIDVTFNAGNITFSLNSAIKDLIAENSDLLDLLIGGDSVTFYLDVINGDDSNSGLTRSTPMKTVAAVVALARSMAGGDYNVGKYRLTILGEGETISFNGDTLTNTVLFNANDFRSDPYVPDSDILPFQVITSEDRGTSLIFSNTLKITGDALFIGCKGSVTVTNGSDLSVSGNVYVKAKNLTLTNDSRIGGGADTIVDVTGTLEISYGGGISCGGDIVVNAKNINLTMGFSIYNGGSRCFRALKDITVEYLSPPILVGAVYGITDLEAGNNILIRNSTGPVSVGDTYPFNMRAGNDITIHTTGGLCNSKGTNIVAGGTVRIADTIMPYGVNITAKNITDVIDEDISGGIEVGLDVEDLENLKTMTLFAKDTIEVTGLVVKFGIEAVKLTCHRLNVTGFINASGSLFIDTDELIINSNLSNISDTSLNLYINAKKATLGDGCNIYVVSPRTEGYDEVYIYFGNAPIGGYIYLDGQLNALVEVDEVKGSFECYMNAANAVLTGSKRRLIERAKTYQNNINVTSSDSFLAITEDIDEETNTKTFDLTANSEAPTEKNYLNATSVIAQTTAEQYFEEFSIINGDIPLHQEGWFNVPASARLLDISVTLDIELVGAPSPEYETVQFRIKDKDLVTYFVESRQVDWSLDHNVLTFQAKLKDINSLLFSFTSYNHDCNVYMTVRVNDESFLTFGENNEELISNRFIASYDMTENAEIHEEFEKGSVVICFRGYSYAEYLPLIRRIVKTSYPDPQTYAYVFGAVYGGRVVEITSDPVDGWSVLETPVGGDCHEFTIVEASASITGGVATVSIEQGDLYIVDLSEETTITDIEIVLTNNASDEFPLWWFKIESGSAATLSVKIGAAEVRWLGSAITNIGLGKTIEVSVVDNVACGGELV